MRCMSCWYIVLDFPRRKNTCFYTSCVVWLWFGHLFQAMEFKPVASSFTSFHPAQARPISLNFKKFFRSLPEAQAWGLKLLGIPKPRTKASWSMIYEHGFFFWCNTPALLAIDQFNHNDCSWQNKPVYSVRQVPSSFTCSNVRCCLLPVLSTRNPLLEFQALQLCHWNILNPPIPLYKRTMSEQAPGCWHQVGHPKTSSQPPPKAANCLKRPHKAQQNEKFDYWSWYPTAHPSPCFRLRKVLKSLCLETSVHFL